ncbi:hypothetical protein P154DRAFT_189221 [Amniculicola lignicola CBS 123094]|uniref:Secreted protein n=1 Tax=Amniculicola lignicola CBS 123094 TaxID=1392246 RepID=A0A6A5WG23_9PLEO|nr:hypothetical protein P154DRAFT_189221 [Amniculicola lignicola CBS 123094]
MAIGACVRRSHILLTFMVNALASQITCRVFGLYFPISTHHELLGLYLSDIASFQACMSFSVCNSNSRLNQSEGI